MQYHPSGFSAADWHVYGMLWSKGKVDFYVDDPETSPETIAAIDRAAEILGKLGATVEEITLPDYALFNAAGRTILFAEAFARDNAGNNNAARMAMIAMTTSNSIRVNPRSLSEFFLMQVWTM